MKLTKLGLVLGALTMLVSACSVYTAPVATDKNLYFLETTTILLFTLPPVAKVCDLDGSNCKTAMK